MFLRDLDHIARGVCCDAPRTVRALEIPLKRKLRAGFSDLIVHLIRLFSDHGRNTVVGIFHLFSLVPLRLVNRAGRPNQMRRHVARHVLADGAFHNIDARNFKASFLDFRNRFDLDIRGERIGDRRGKTALIHFITHAGHTARVERA